MSIDKYHNRLIMDYKVLSRYAAERYSTQKHDKTSVVISIRSSWDKILPAIECNNKNNIKAVLSLAFDDIDFDTAVRFNDWDNIGYVTTEQARKIYEFCNEWFGKVDIFIFHCDGGISRSAGCCGAIMRWFEGFDYPIMGMKSKYPNMQVYNKVLDACRQIEGVPYTRVEPKNTKVIDEPVICKHFSVENGNKNGRPCDIHGVCNPYFSRFGCNDYEEENLKELIESLPDD